MKWIAVAVAAAFLASSCATSSGPSDLVSSPARAAESGQPPSFSPPPLVVISDDGSQVELPPFAYCWSGGDVSLCADGDPWLFAVNAVTGNGSFSVDWPLDGWSWTVETRARQEACETVLPRLTNVSAGDAIPAPPAGDLVVLMGRGPEGDAAYAFEPNFRSAPGLPDTSAVVMFAPADVETVDASGLAVWVSNMASEPEFFAASAFVQGAEGRIAEFDLIPETREGCWSGTIYAAVDPEAHLVTLPGFQAPITISVDLVIDGVALRSEQVAWPGDFRAGIAESPNLVLGEMGN